MTLPDQSALIAAVLLAGMSYYGYKIFRPGHNVALAGLGGRNRQRFLFGTGLALFLSAPIYFAIALRLYPYPARSNIVADVLFGLLCPIVGAALMGWAIWLFEKQKRGLV